MLNKTSKDLIKQVISLYKKPRIDKEILDMGINHLKRICDNHSENENEKVYVLDVPDSELEYNDIKIALDDVIELEVGEDLGMVAHLLPHHWARNNPFELKTSNCNVVDIEGYILTAKSVGSAIITATTLNGKYSDSITVNVVEPYMFTATEEETYYMESGSFGLINHLDEHDPYDQDIAFTNSNAIKSAILFAKENGYNKLVFPKDEIYYYDPSEKIYLKNDLIIDLNGSTWQIYPNYFYNCTGISFAENYKMVNVSPRRWKNYTTSIGHVAYKDTYWQNENGSWVWSYIESNSNHLYELNYNTGGEDGIIELNDYIYNLKQGVTYKGSLFFIKQRVSDYQDSNYTSNNILIDLLCYKENDIIDSINIGKLSWNKNIRQGTININFTLNNDYDKFLIRVSGLSDPNYPLNVAIGDIKLYELKEISEFSRNMIIENGNILGDKSLADSEGNELKTKLFNKLYGKDWRHIGSTEGSMNLEISEGDHSGCRNMTIGNTCGFNIGIGGGKILTSYYKNAKTDYEYGSFDNLGNKIDNDRYVRSITPYAVNITKSPYFIVTDPTFQTTYYFGYRTRIIDLYFYDKDMNFINFLRGKFRHGVIKAPEGTCYINIGAPLVPGESFVPNGHSDFGNCIFSIKFLHPINKCFFSKCNIINNYSCGMAHSGMGVLVENCYFNKNIGRMPWADVDSEDGWMRMQNNTFRNNSFNSYYGFIMCSGTNYVVKNNEFNCPVKLWGDTQYYKVFGNTFKNNGAIGVSGLGTSADLYVANNIFEDIPVNTDCNKNNVKAYFNNNTFNGGYLRLASHVISTNDKLNSKISIDVTNHSLINNHNEDYFKNITKLDFSAGGEYSYSNFGDVEIGLKSNKDFIFNNCKFNSMPGAFTGFSDIGNGIFNNCTLINPKTVDTFKYNNCKLITQPIDSYIINGILRDNLIFTQKNANGSYNILNTNRFLKGTDSWSICTLFKKINNYYCRIIESNKLSLGVGHGGTSVDVRIFRTNDNDATSINHQWSTNINSSIVGDNDYYIVIVTYDSELGEYSIYVNNTKCYTYTLPSGYKQAKTGTIRTWGQGNFLYYYIYDKKITEEEIALNTEILKNWYLNNNL